MAAGDYERQLTLSGNDELGFLLRSFNTMTRKIARSRAIADQSQRMEAMQKSYLESVMEHITSGYSPSMKAASSKVAIQLPVQYLISRLISSPRFISRTWLSSIR